MSHFRNVRGIEVALYRAPRAEMHMINNYRRQWRHLAWGLALVLGSVASASVHADQQGQQRQGQRGQHGKLSSRARDEASRKGSAKMDVIVRFRRAPGAAENMLVQ